MSDILILQDGNVEDALVATSLVKRLVQEGNRIHCITDEDAVDLFRCCDGAFVETFRKQLCGYDIAINLSPTDICTEAMNRVKAKYKRGYGNSDGKVTFYNAGAERHFTCRHVGLPSTSNLFQLTFGVAEKAWHGEGYHLRYFPRNRSNKTSTGVAVRHDKLRTYLMNNLRLTKSKLWQIPFKRNILKQVDETNRCKHIVTDDAAILHISLALRKNVEYIVSKLPSYRIEMFGEGAIHIFDSHKLNAGIPYVRPQTPYCH